MHDLLKIRRKTGEVVCKTIASPIMVLDYLELKEAIAGLGLIFLFGIIYPAPLLLTLLIIGVWGVWPQVRSKFEKGLVIHFLYRQLGFKIPGIISIPKKEMFSI